MAEPYSTERLRDLARSIQETADPQLIENRKILAEKRLRSVSKDSNPLAFAEIHFELACCYLLRHDRRVKGRHIQRAEEHYEMAASALTDSIYVNALGVIQCTLAEGYSRLLSKRDLQDRVHDRMYELFHASATSLQEGHRFLEAAAVYVRMADLCLEEHKTESASSFLDFSLSLVPKDESDDFSKRAAVLDSIFEAQQRLVEASDESLVSEQERFSARSAHEAISVLEPGLRNVPVHILDELDESVRKIPIETEGRFYSLRELVQSYRRRGTAYLFEPLPDTDLIPLDSVGPVRGSQLSHLLNQYRNARTSPLGYAIVPVYYATDRRCTGGPSPEQYFADGRDPKIQPSLSYGVASVSIPRDHVTGVIEAPKLWKLQIRDNPEKHVSVLSISPLKHSAFFSSLDSDLDANAGGTTLLFVHGYRVTFADSLKRTAQICYDLGWKGIPLTYSWPSSATTKLYLADEASVEATAPFFVQFLEDLIRRKRLHLLHIICHSMGSRAVINALITLKRKKHLPAVNELVFAAPDIDNQVFAQKAPAVRAKCERITLYASSKDRALAASRALHAFPRAGESGPNMMILPDLLDTIDASAVDTDLLGHSYYGDNRSILGDIYNLVKGRSAPPRFGLQQMESPKGRYWAFQA